MKKLIQKQMDGQFTPLEQSSFDTFDPDNFSDDFDPDTFDPDNVDGKIAKPGTAGSKVKTGKVGKMQAQFDITITSSLTAGTSLVIELFNGFNSQAFAQNTQINPYTPVDTADLVSTIASAAGGVNTTVAVLQTQKVYFDKLGNLIYSTDATHQVKIACKQVPYVALFRSATTQPFMVEKVRMTVTTNGQISNDIVHTINTFLGSKSRNTISPRAYFRPDQFQSLIIDIPAGFRVDGEKGLQYEMNGQTGGNNEVVVFNTFLSRYVKQSI